MKVSEVANRYARAVYELATENKSQDKVFSDLRSIEQAFTADADVFEFLTSPLIAESTRLKAVEQALTSKPIAPEARDLVLLLARKDRLALIKEIVHAYESQADDANGVCRGTVRSATTLAQTDRQRIEETVEQVLKKKVIMTYKVDPTVIGGLVAQVGSYTFDDSIASHLTRMNEELKRRTV